MSVSRRRSISYICKGFSLKSQTEKKRKFMAALCFVLATIAKNLIDKFLEHILIIKNSLSRIRRLKYGIVRWLHEKLDDDFVVCINSFKLW